MAHLTDGSPPSGTERVGARVSKKMPFWAVTAIAVAQVACKGPDPAADRRRRAHEDSAKDRRPRQADRELEHERARAGPPPRLLSRRGLWEIARDTVNKWLDDKCPQLGAALAYYTVFSIVPLLIVIIAIAGLAFGQKAAEGQILQQLGTLVGESSANAVQTMVEKARNPTKGIFSAALGIITLLAGASGVFGQLQDALNTIWGVAPKPGGGIWRTIKQRFFSFVALLGTGFLLLVSLVISAMLATLGHAIPSVLPAPEFLLEILNFVISLAVITALFAMIFKVLPDARVAWRDVAIGAICTAVLFTIGKFAIGLYLGKSDIATTYGAAASIVVILLWVYYSSQLLLMGAEFTAVYASRYGSHITPTPDAVAVDEPALSGSQRGAARRR
jgi:membrane protein